MYWVATVHRTSKAHLLVERVKEHDCLHRLAEAHLIGQDGVGALSPGEPQPVQTLQLVRMQRSAGGVDVPRLVLELDGRLVSPARGKNRNRRKKHNMGGEVNGLVFQICRAKGTANKINIL